MHPHALTHKVTTLHIFFEMASWWQVGGILAWTGSHPDRSRILWRILCILLCTYLLFIELCPTGSRSQTPWINEVACLLFCLTQDADVWSVKLNWSAPLLKHTWSLAWWERKIPPTSRESGRCGCHWRETKASASWWQKSSPVSFHADDHWEKVDKQERLRLLLIES